MAKENTPRPQPRGGIQLELGETEGQGTYSNLAVITHSSAEMILDFARVLPGVPKAKIYSRIVMTPFHAKALHKALGDNLEKFEKQHGPIPTPDPNDQNKNIGF